jgi:hypothetical protein
VGKAGISGLTALFLGLFSAETIDIAPRYRPDTREGAQFEPGVKNVVLTLVRYALFRCPQIRGVAKIMIGEPWRHVLTLSALVKLLILIAVITFATVDVSAEAEPSQIEKRVSTILLHAKIHLSHPYLVRSRHRTRRADVPADVFILPRCHARSKGTLRQITFGPTPSVCYSTRTGPDVDGCLHHSTRYSLDGHAGISRPSGGGRVAIGTVRRGAITAAGERMRMMQQWRALPHQAVLMKNSGPTLQKSNAKTMEKS